MFGTLWARGRRKASLSSLFFLRKCWLHTCLRFGDRCLFPSQTVNRGWEQLSCYRAPSLSNLCHFLTSASIILLFSPCFAMFSLLATRLSAAAPNSEKALVFHIRFSRQMPREPFPAGTCKEESCRRRDTAPKSNTPDPCLPVTGTREMERQVRQLRGSLLAGTLWRSFCRARFPSNTKDRSCRALLNFCN